MRCLQISILSLLLLVIGCKGLDRLLEGSTAKYGRSEGNLIDAPNPTFKGVLLGSMKVTSYRPEPQFTDSTPCIPANGKWVHSDGIAVSRDLHVRWGGGLRFGDLVYIEDVGFKIVADTMNKRHKNHVDVLVWTLKEEQQFHKQFKGQKKRVWKIEKED